MIGLSRLIATIHRVCVAYTMTGRSRWKPYSTNYWGQRQALNRLCYRSPIGLILAAHGGQKLFGWFGGFGLEGTGQFMDAMGLHPGYLMGLFAGSAEFFGGLGLVLGLFTRIAAGVNAITMIIALCVVHWGKGFFMGTHGIEYALALSAATTALFIMGGGSISLDRSLERRFLIEPL